MNTTRSKNLDRGQREGEDALGHGMGDEAGGGKLLQSNREFLGEREQNLSLSPMANVVMNRTRNS